MFISEYSFAKSDKIFIYCVLIFGVCGRGLGSSCSSYKGDFSFVKAEIDRFSHYDRNKNGRLDWREFNSIYRDLFRNDKTGQQYDLPQSVGDDIFEVFDQNSDGAIDRGEFIPCASEWIAPLKHPRSAFLAIDVQNDFISGPLNISSFPAGHNGKDVVEPINQVLRTVHFGNVYFAMDYHPANHSSFIENVHLRELDPSSEVSAANAKVFDTVVFKGPPKETQKLWPRHCVQGTWGSDLHKDLILPNGTVRIFKGTKDDVDSYSAFWDNNKLSETALNALLRKDGVTNVYIAGLAYDVCVRASALDALKLGYNTILIDDCSRGLDPAGIEATRKSVLENHGLVVNSTEVKDMVDGMDRRPELGFKLALTLKRKTALTLKRKTENENERPEKRISSVHGKKRTVILIVATVKGTALGC
ncbi:unnamed protein product [Bemisia tabaci]|uniref:nicotinamidase n=1 Tax=Bemisia tabaci TaxID=7038 RepID=A0A9P0EYE4_BEMTA|nr:unnamed protein product [Bemisia tabaci]